MAQIFIRALGVTNIAAFGSWAVQWRPLIGERGILPVADWVKQHVPGDASWRQRLRITFSRGCIFALIGGSDVAVSACIAAGLASGALLVADVWSTAAALVSAMCYLSLLKVSQPWLGLQMDANLVETNTLFGLMYGMSAVGGGSSMAWVWAQRWLIFRVMVGCGAAKLGGGDPSWRDMTAMTYHYETQPLPNMLSRFMHMLPSVCHRWSTAVTYICECGIPLLYFGSPAMRAMAFVLTVGFNMAIGITGNYGHLHLLTITEALALLVCSPAECSAHKLLPQVMCLPSKDGWSVAGALSGLVGWCTFLAYVALSWPPLARTFDSIVSVYFTIPGYHQVEVASARLSDYRLINYYSKFTHMTKERLELEIELSGDGGCMWHYVSYAAKPGGEVTSLSTVPRTLLVGYIPRFDWRLWFLPLGVQRFMRRGQVSAHDVQVEPWFAQFCHLLLSDTQRAGRIVNLPPPLRQAARVDMVRVSIYKYEFVTQQGAEEVSNGASESASSGQVLVPPVADAPSLAPDMPGSSTLRQRRAPGGEESTASRHVKLLHAASSKQQHSHSASHEEPWSIGRVWRRKRVATWFTLSNESERSR